ncbi:NAD-dependent epimerase/dehydratase family protein [Variovorax sp. J22G73]|uniref:D-erythronate dehydrogenase n=1 Tax=unclassified Variovorax TaxID=663243 RepID=UPI002578C20E|nr:MULTISPECIES: D-erythronate dehydrogenase [unclassified Variovorax]MDM0008363.1 NAD-dependent epimerase/dehydratase family protein [Variovorax sp. J22R203]MDM0100870.1 NAD-dependent epimerase/dehydratase family protein [Variovorax sp. J22G73]
MHIVITGGAGFLGARLARTLLAQGRLSLAGAPAQTIRRITLVDRAPPPADLAADPRVDAITGDLNAQLAGDGADGANGGVADDTVWREAHAIFHLAAAVSGECEADFDLGMRSNFAATHALLEKVRALGTRPVLVFSSSLAVFGDSPEQPLPQVIEDHTLPTPQTSYGIQKFIGEQLVADFTRKGFVRGRSVRLMTVSVRPGKPNGAASGFFSGMIREPLAGLPAACPVPDATPVAIASPARTVEGLVRAASASDAEWGPRTALNLPSLATTVGDMAAALERVAGKAATALLDRTPDAAIQRIVKTWPGHFETARARALGLAADESFEAVIREYVRENPDAVKLPGVA